MSHYPEASAVPTARGPIAPEELGVVLPHEHLFVRNIEFARNFPRSWNEDEGVRRAVAELGEAYDAGVRTIIDMTVLGQGRDPGLIARVAAATEVNIVLATGLYALDGLPQIIRYRGPGAPLEGPDPLVDLLEADIREGIGGTGMRAALVKFVCEKDEDDATVRRLAAAVAEVHRRTAVPVVVHTDPANGSALRALKELDALGVAPERVVLAHVDAGEDPGYLRELAETGAFLSCDQFGMSALGPDERRVRTVVELIRAGRGAQVLISHDRASHLDHLTAEQRAAVYPEWEYTHIGRRILPLLAAQGVGEAEIDAIMRDNPRRLLTAGATAVAGARAGTTAGER
jgi:phosphotriesterase-related protein